MKKRTRKVLSLLLAASMVFTMNTAAFAEEAVDVAAEPAVGELVEVVEDDGASVEIDIVKDDTEEADAAVEESGGAADADAAVDGSEDAAVDAETNDAANGVMDIDGLLFKVKDDGSRGDLITDVTYASNGDKKNPRNNIATIKNTTDPVSWNNSYAEANIYTILFGENEEATHLNYTSTVTASENGLGKIPQYSMLTGKLKDIVDIPKGLRVQPYLDHYRYFVEPITEGSSYLLIGYAFNNPANQAQSQLVLVDDDNGKTKILGQGKEESLVGIPAVQWDGRKIDYNKSGHHKFTTSKRELLDVAVAVVTYNNGTVTEVPGISVKSVKVDKKNQKKASVALENEAVSENLLEGNENSGELESKVFTVIQQKKLGDLPFFTLAANVKGNDARTYKKDINKILKDKKFYFGILQHGVLIDFSGDKKYKPIQTLIKKAVVSENLFDDNEIEHSAYEVKEDDNQFKFTISGDTAPIEKMIAELIADESYFDSDVDSIIINEDRMKVSRFNGKKAVINVRNNVGDDEKGYEMEDLGTLKEKKDYTIDTTGSVAGTTVNILDFPAGGNYVYVDYCWYGLPINVAGKAYYGPYDIAGALGYKYAFRKSPVEKSKKFRGGLYAKDNTGFVYED